MADPNQSCRIDFVCSPPHPTPWPLPYCYPILILNIPKLSLAAILFVYTKDYDAFPVTWGIGHDWIVLGIHENILSHGVLDITGRRELDIVDMMAYWT